MDSEWYKTLSDAHYALMREYVNIIRATGNLRFFSKLPSVNDRDRQQLNSLIDEIIPGKLSRPLREAWKIALRAEITPIRNRTLAQRKAAREEQTSKHARIDFQELPRRMFYGTKGIAEGVAFSVPRSPIACYDRYFSLARFFILGPLVRQAVRRHIRATLARLRTLYIAERSATPTHTGDGKSREILSQLIEDTSDFLQRNEDISKLSLGRGEVRSTIGGAINVGLPGGITLLILNQLSEQDVFRQAISDIVTGNIDWSRLQAYWVAIGAVSFAAIILFLGLVIWVQIMVFYTKKSLFRGGGLVIFGRKEDSETSTSASELEERIFLAFGMNRPQEARSDIWYWIVYVVGVLLGVVVFLLTGQTL